MAEREARTALRTVLSLGIAGIMFMGGTTLLSSLDMERLARHGLLEYGEFEVELSRNAIKNDPHGQTGVQLKNPLNEDLIQTIAQMEGVAEVSEYKTLEAKFEYNGVTKKENITPFTPDQQALLEKYLVTGTADYSTMSENHEILVLRNEYADYIYDWTFHVGDTVKFRWFDGIREQETEFRIAGEISDGIFEDDGGGKLFGKTGFFLLPEELMNQMMPSGFNFNSQLLVRMDDLLQEPALRKTMNDLLDTTPMVTMETHGCGRYRHCGSAAPAAFHTTRRWLADKRSADMPEYDGWCGEPAVHRSWCCPGQGSQNFLFGCLLHGAVWCAADAGDAV